MTSRPIGLKRGELRPCRRCGKGMLHAGVPVFYRVTLETFGAETGAIRRAAGLEMMLGGNIAIAMALGPDEDLARRVGAPKSDLLCLPCAMEISVAELLEDREEEQEHT